LSVIVPVLNERREFRSYGTSSGGCNRSGEFGDIEFVFVDDGSNDGTLLVYMRLSQKAIPVESFPTQESRCRCGVSYWLSERDRQHRVHH